LRRRFPVYLIDQPRRGRAARSTQPITITATPDEQLWFGIFRLGAWPNFYPGVQFSRDPEAKCRLPWVPITAIVRCLRRSALTLYAS
jgi:hypothetical protein